RQTSARADAAPVLERGERSAEPFQRSRRGARDAARAARRRARAPSGGARPALPMRVSQVLCAAGPVDAVTNQAFAWRRKFDGWGWSGADYSARLAPGFRSAELNDLEELEPAVDEVVLVHYSGYAAGLDRVAASTGR